MKVQIQTPQNVTLEYNVADLGHRIGAMLIDWFVQGAYVVALVLFLADFLGQISDASLRIVLTVILFLPLLLYGLLFELFMNGQTIGKRAVNIRVIRLDGEQPTAGNYIMRWLIGLAEIYAFMGVVAMLAVLVSDKGQRIGDRAAGTTVIRTRAEATLDDTIFAPTEEDYEPVFEGVVRLSDRDVAVIKEVIDSSSHSSNPAILSAVTSRVKGVIGSSTDLSPIEFLRTVVRDYNHITSRM